MRKYERVTIESVQLRGMTAWRVVGWIMKETPLTIAYFPTQKGAKNMQKAIMQSGLSTGQPSKR